MVKERKREPKKTHHPSASCVGDSPCFSATSQYLPTASLARDLLYRSMYPSNRLSRDVDGAPPGLMYFLLFCKGSVIFKGEA